MKSLYILYGLILGLSFTATSCKHRVRQDKREKQSASEDTLKDPELKEDNRVSSTLDLKDMPYTTDLNKVSVSGKQRSDYVINYFAEQPIGLFPLNKADALDFFQLEQSLQLE